MFFKWRRKIKNIEQDNKYANEMISYLDEIRFNLEKGSISKKNLETFLKKIKNKETSNIKDKNKRIEKKNNDKNNEVQIDNYEKKKIIIQKLGLIKLILENTILLVNLIDWRK